MSPWVVGLAGELCSMARQEQDREDLLAEAKALVERIELALPDVDDPVVVGFRSNGCGSIYFGAQPAWHFNSRFELRRAYLDDRLLKAERGQLVSLARVRTADSTQLVRHELSAAESRELLLTLTHSLQAVGDALARADFRPLRQAPGGVDLIPRVQAWLEELTPPIAIAASPHAR